MREQKQWEVRTEGVPSREGPKVPVANRIRKGQKLGINGFFFRVTEIIFRNLFSYQPCFHFMDLTFNRISHRQGCRQWLSTVTGVLALWVWRASQFLDGCIAAPETAVKLPVSKVFIQHILKSLGVFNVTSFISWCNEWQWHTYVHVVLFPTV